MKVKGQKKAGCTSQKPKMQVSLCMSDRRFCVGQSTVELQRPFVGRIRKCTDTLEISNPHSSVCALLTELQNKQEGAGFQGTMVNSLTMGGDCRKHPSSTSGVKRTSQKTKKQRNG